MRNRRSSLFIAFGCKVLLAIAAFLPAASVVAAGPAKRVDFKTEVRPILSNRCFACHGPDEAHVESGLRLDLAASATAPADSGRIAVVPSQVEESELIRRVLSQDESERMPPEHFAGRLTSAEIDVLKRWIQQGATYSKHWSFDAIVPPVIDPAMVDCSHFPTWAHSSIDFLVLKKLQEKGWTPSPRADRRALLRRVYLDLTGLPPTLDQQRAFLDDTSELAYENAIDSLLASPAYGEHWGRKWLDLARYADSAGYADDPQRTIWGYRDWVIRAINSGMPFDQFTTEQLAGDLLPHPTDDQLVATAFHRNTLTNNEGGTNDEEFRNVAIVDRVNTTMAVWMGITMACAQCHSHKYDPITQREYFQVFAVFNQSEDADRTDESPTLPWFTPQQRDSLAQLRQRLSQLETQLNTPDPNFREEQQRWEERLGRSISWEPAQPSDVRAQSQSKSEVIANGEIVVAEAVDNDVYTLEIPIASPEVASQWTGIRLRTLPNPLNPALGAGGDKGNFVLSKISAALISSGPESAIGKYVRVELNGSNKILSLAEVQVWSKEQNVAPKGKASQSSTGFEGAAERAIDGNTSGVYADNSTTHSGINDPSPWWEVELAEPTPVDRIEVWNRLEIGERLAGARVVLMDADRRVLWESQIDPKPRKSQAFQINPSLSLPLASVRADYAQPNFDAAGVLDSDAKSGWAVAGAIDRPHALTLAIDGERWAQALSKSPIAAPWKLQLQLEHASPYRKAVLQRFAIDLTRDPLLLEMHGTSEPMLALLAKEPGQRSTEESDQLRHYYGAEVAPSRSPLRAERTRLQTSIAAIKPATTVPIMRERTLAQQRKTHVQLRGNYRVLGDLVEPGVPVAFHSITGRREVGSSTSLRDATNTDSTTPSNTAPESVDRLQLTQWLLQPDNPLTARVIANRYWESLFGVGIVRSSEDFGSQGDLPSNPELLDHLATELIRTHWDTKGFLRKIVLSEAYRQQSFVSPRRFEEDPENIFISRGPRMRVPAEQVRDMALATAGLLSNRMYGPPTRPPQPSMGLSAAFGSGTDWETSKGADRYRRALYTQWRRSNPYPSMATFDAPNREVCVLKRDRTNTPLQALVTMNDPAFVEAAQGLARRVLAEEGNQLDTDARIELLFQWVVSRMPRATELASLKKLVTQVRDELRNEPDRAQKLATDPMGPVPSGMDITELATWTVACNVLLNLDEFLMTP